ncbi:PTS system, mannose-specific IIA component [Mariprofundus micogutta]|uniref:PTS system, mannose-specific IIA component n=1 Tax=Mariprofundus micogutta TaxID=1921010 RepID=A0A1L8CNJ6_9PROT|nr:PTS sugar transporter subunit IIA [Mariprofundus micogutta]GAV20477.1 PTS system, mannose-specific IIA component [Mariprofundus micogutta]
MIGIVLIGHERIASEMLAAMEHIVGKQPLIEVLDVLDSQTPDELTRSMQAKIRACDIGKGVLLLADMFGGTPCNIAMGCLQAGHVEVVSGFNLPLLIKAATLRDKQKNLAKLAEQVVESGRLYMRIAPHLHNTGQSDKKSTEGGRR